MLPSAQQVAQQIAPKSFQELWKFIAAALRMALIASPAAPFIGLARLAFGDALRFGLMNTVELVLVMPMLGMDAARRLQQLGLGNL